MILMPNQKVRVRFVNYDDFPANCTVQAVRGNLVRVIQHEQCSRLNNRRGWFAPIFLRNENGKFFAVDMPFAKAINADLEVAIYPDFRS